MAQPHAFSCLEAGGCRAKAEGVGGPGHFERTRANARRGGQDAPVGRQAPGSGVFGRRIGWVRSGREGFLQEAIDIGPERSPHRPFALGQTVEGVFVPDTREIGVFSPMLESSGDGLALFAALVGLEKAGPCFELGFEPGAGLVAELGAIGIGERLFRPAACFLSV